MMFFKSDSIMKRIIFMAFILGCVTACHKEPSLSQYDGEFMVYTAHSPEISDFSVYKTFTVADSLLYMDGNKGTMNRNSWDQNVLKQYISSMESLGYTYVDTGKLDSDQTQDAPEGDADLGIQVSYVVTTDYFTTHVPYDPYWWYGYPGYWNPGYWGNWGSWYYSYPVTYSYSTQSLLTEMVDLTAEQGDDKQLPVVWNSYIEGNIGNSRNDMARFSRGIAQSFAQSEYLDRN